MTESFSWDDMLETAAEGGSFDPLPPGNYAVQVREADATVSSTKKPMFKIVLEVTQGPHAKRRLWTNLVISKDNSAAMGLFFRKMAAFGITREYFKEHNPSMDAIATALNGRGALATVAIKKYQGEDRNEVTNLSPAPISTMPPGYATAASMPPAPAAAPPPAAAAPPPPPVAAPAPPPPAAAPPAAPAAAVPAAAESVPNGTVSEPVAAAAPPPPPAPAPPPPAAAPHPTSNMEDPPF